MKTALRYMPFTKLLLMVPVALALATPCDAFAKNGPDAKRVTEIVHMLPAQPAGVGPTIEQRVAWDAVAQHPKFRKVIAKAESLLNKPMPKLTDDVFLDFSRTGNRTRGQRVLGERQGRVPALVLAECLENRGRFLPAIMDAIRDLCADKTWVLPAHDRRLNNFRGTEINIDLRSSAVAWQLATADYWLGDRLDADVRQLIREKLEQRIFTPFEASLNTGKPRLWWVTGTNNWNSVCLAGVTGAALAVIPEPERRAWFVAAAEKNVQHLMNGFTDDGYCSEGLGYWNYGFGHFALLAETVDQATDGKLDLFELEKARDVARFGRRIEIIPGVYPAFADCKPTQRPDTKLQASLSRRYGFGWVHAEQNGLLLAGGPSGYLFRLGAYGFENSASQRPAAKTAPSLPPRDWFPDAQVLIARPVDPSSNAMGVAIKGGHNAEHHNHNDVGSFVVAVAGKAPLLDPGGEIYTRRTFSGQRYESDVLNSFGHPVPLVAGKKQHTGRAAAAEIVETKWTDGRDVLELDLLAAYNVPELKTLRRRFEFSREGNGQLTVIDRVEFRTPQTFGIALVTFSERRQLAPNRWLIGSGKSAVQVDIETDGGKIVFSETQLTADLGKRIAHRLGFDLAEPVTQATVRMSITPAK